ncbi:MAG: NAD(P)H-dependent oxidoreductase [Nitrosomonadales bacterium]|nr:NAD(P)H-dependent oxidoreductase [Nitrosomonadales bacterium]
MARMKIFAISGSLRAASHNTALLHAAARVAPANIVIELYRDLGKLPPFNPDLEEDDPPAVARLREKLIEADAVLIASPEYAHGVSGVLKNALDWMVSSEAFVNKPVALLNASPRAVHAQAALKETLTVMSALVIEKSSITLPILGSGLSEELIVANFEISIALTEALRVLHAEVQRLVGKVGV